VVTPLEVKRKRREEKGREGKRREGKDTDVTLTAFLMLPLQELLPSIPPDGMTLLKQVG